MEDIPDEEEAAEEVKGVFVEGKRWLDGGYLASNLTAVTEEVVAITTKHLIKFIFLRSGKSRLYVPGCESDGVSLGLVVTTCCYTDQADDHCWPP